MRAIARQCIQRLAHLLGREADRIQHGFRLHRAHGPVEPVQVVPVTGQSVHLALDPAFGLAAIERDDFVAAPQHLVDRGRADQTRSTND